RPSTPAATRAPAPAPGGGRAWGLPGPPDAAARHEAAHRLLGRHDFTTFRAAECQAQSPVKTLDRLDVARDGDEIHVQAAARSFLHTQVRSMVGSLAFVGDGRWSGEDIVKVLAERDRIACAPPAVTAG